MTAKAAGRVTMPMVSWRRMLEAIPHRNEAADAREQATGEWQITLPLRRPWWLSPPFSWVLHPATSRTVRLDVMGGAVWQLCDGRTVEEIIDAFAGRYALTFHEARVAVTTFLRMLIERRLVVIERPVSETGSGGDR